MPPQSSGVVYSQYSYMLSGVLCPHSSPLQWHTLDLSLGVVTGSRADQPQLLYEELSDHLGHSLL